MKIQGADFGILTVIGRMCDLKATNERRRHHPRSMGPPKAGIGLGEISLVIDECTFTGLSGGHMLVMSRAPVRCIRMARETDSPLLVLAALVPQLGKVHNNRRPRRS